MHRLDPADGIGANGVAQHEHGVVRREYRHHADRCLAHRREARRSGARSGDARGTLLAARSAVFGRPRRRREMEVRGHASNVGACAGADRHGARRRYRASVAEASEDDRVVFLHGQPGAGIEWHRVVQLLDPSVDVLAPDRPGYGNNPLEAGGFDDNAEWLTGVITDHFGARPVVVVAHSWSGGVALALALRRPDLVRAIALVSSIGPGAVTPIDRLLAHPALGPVTTRATFRLASPALRWLLTRSGLARDTRAAMLDALDASRARGVWRSFLTEQLALVDEFPHLLARLDAVTPPVIVVAGTRDLVVPSATATALARQLPAATLVPVRGGGHLLQHTHPRVVADAVSRALAESARS